MGIDRKSDDYRSGGLCGFLFFLLLLVIFQKDPSAIKRTGENGVATIIEVWENRNQTSYVYTYEVSGNTFIDSKTFVGSSQMEIGDVARIKYLRYKPQKSILIGPVSSHIDSLFLRKE